MVYLVTTPIDKHTPLECVLSNNTIHEKGSPLPHCEGCRCTIGKYRFGATKRRLHLALWRLRMLWYSLCEWGIITTHRILAKLGFTMCQGFQGPCCRLGTRQPRNTAYADEASNWVTMCPRCAEAEAEHWRERWEEYYSGCL